MMIEKLKMFDDLALTDWNKVWFHTVQRLQFKGFTKLIRGLNPQTQNMKM